MDDDQDIGTVEPHLDHYDEVLTPQALHILAESQRRFGPVRSELLQARQRRQLEVRARASLDFRRQGVPAAP